MGDSNSQLIIAVSGLKNIYCHGNLLDRRRAANTLLHLVRDGHRIGGFFTPDERELVNFIEYADNMLKQLSTYESLPWWRKLLTRKPGERR